MLRRIGRADPTRSPGDRAGVARLIGSLVDAERGGPDLEALARRAAELCEARSLRLTVGDEVVRVGRRGDDDVPSDLPPGQLVPTDHGFTRRVGADARVLVTFDDDVDPAGRRDLVAAVSDWLELRLDQRSVARETERAARAELRALRAQISPHFAFNAMGAIATLIRIDPERAHALLLDFADYTRYSFGKHGEYTTLAEELRSIEIYLSLERARFGDRLRVHVVVPPEVLHVLVPFLVLQPLVENAIRHGIEPLPRGGHVRVEVRDTGADVRIEVEDDGAGADPAMVEDLLSSAAGDGPERDHVGLHNIDERLRTVYGDAHGLVVETAPGAGTKVVVTIPKYRPEVTA